MERQTLTVKEVSAYLGVHQDTIYAMVRKKEMPHVKLRHRILFTRESIDAWLREQEHMNLR